jgi:hypothetical protein
MMRVLAILSAIALAAGCRANDPNPFAAFGAATIPPPTIEVPGSGPYYPAPAAGSATPTPPANSLPSISVPSGGTTAPQPSIPRPYSFGSLAPSGSPSTSSFATDPADREPIRVVEAAPSAIRVATAPTSGSRSPGVVEATPTAREPIRAFNTNSSGRTTTIPPYEPLFGRPPATNGLKSSGTYRADGSVQPAAYQQPGDGGQWRSR